MSRFPYLQNVVRPAWRAVRTAKVMVVQIVRGTISKWKAKCKDYQVSTSLALFLSQHLAFQGGTQTGMSFGVKCLTSCKTWQQL